MAKFSSDGEVFGSKFLTLAIIAVSAFVLAGTITSPSPQTPKAQSAQTQQIVDRAHAPAHGVSG